VIVMLRVLNVRAVFHSTFPPTTFTLSYKPAMIGLG
jgi:hypothetical protein